MSGQKPFILIRLWQIFWRSLTWLRIAILNLAFIALIVVFIKAAQESAPEPITEPGPLLLAPSGILVDQLSYQPPLATLSGSNKAPETLTRDLVDMIFVAAKDKRVTGLILKLNDLGGGGLSKLQEIGQAIEHFKAQNKPVVAYSNFYSHQQYYLASYADDIHLETMGHVGITGFGLYRNYFEKVIAKLGINVHVFKSGDFKDFVEPFIRTDMSEPSREHNSRWLQALWQGYLEEIASRRGLTPDKIEALIANYPERLSEHQGDGAQLALAEGLIDHISTRQQLVASLIKSFGADSNNPEQVHTLSTQSYQQELWLRNLQQQGNIGLVVGVGAIQDGEQPEGNIGGDTLAKLIRHARQDKAIQALVLRIDSGGGSAFASEVVRQEILATRTAGKPVVVSMGSMAASGGYWIASAADQIWASPNTLTGSIGVFSIIPTFEGTLDKIGISNDGISTSELASLFHLERPMTPTAEAVFQTSVDGIYDKFLALCAEGRNTSTEAIAKIAGGRVWIGSQAQELGLVDHLGSLNDAMRAAAKLANITTPKMQLIERELSPMEELLRNIAQHTGVQSIASWVIPKSHSRELLGQLQNRADSEPMLEALNSQLKTPNNTQVFALCPECQINF